MNKLYFLLLSIFLIACSSTKNYTTFTIAANQVDCEGVIPQKCLLIKEGNQKEWEYFYDNIEGFSYDQGFEYVIQVHKENISNPPADASSIRYKLIKIISKEQQ